MKISYKTTATLGKEEIYFIIRQYIESKTNKRLIAIDFNDSDDGIQCELVFCEETAELPSCRN